jgi:hypothetical protein
VSASPRIRQPLGFGGTQAVRKSTFTSENAAEFGKRGGSVSSPAKQRAARRNGKRHRRRSAGWPTFRDGKVFSDWQTPPDLFQGLDAEFGFELDVAASVDNALCPRFFTEQDDGLAQSWAPARCWMNPPYSRGVTGRWMEKAYRESLQGALVVALVPVRSDARWVARVRRAGRDYPLAGSPQVPPRWSSEARAVPERPGDLPAAIVGPSGPSNRRGCIKSPRLDTAYCHRRRQRGWIARKRAGRYPLYGQ